MNGLSNDEITHFNKIKKIECYMFNPTLFRKLKVTNYLEHCKTLVKLCGDLSISLEEIADDKKRMLKLAKHLVHADTVFVKILITFTPDKSTKEVIEEL